MLDELDNLSDQLWDIIESRKEENLIYFEQLQNEDPSISLGNSVTECTAAIIKAEIRKLIKSVNLIILFHLYVLKDTEEQVLDIPEIDFYDQELAGYDKIQYMVNTAKEYVDVIPNIPCKAEASNQFLLRIKQIEA